MEEIKKVIQFAKDMNEKDSNLHSEAYQTIIDYCETLLAVKKDDEEMPIMHEF